MTDEMATLIMTTLLISATAGGVTYALLMQFHQRTLLAGVRLGWFVVLFALVTVVFFREGSFIGFHWIYPLGITIGAAVFIARDFARRSDMMVLLVLDLIFGLILLGIVTAIIGPHSGIPLVILLPIVVLAALAWGAHLFRRLHLERGNAEAAARARLVKLWAFALMPVCLFGGLALLGGVPVEPLPASQ